MKQIKAFVRPKKYKDVFLALREAGHCCMTITECEGTGNYTDPKKDFPSLKFPYMHSLVVKMEILARMKEWMLL